MKIILILAGFQLFSGTSTFAKTLDSLWARPNNLKTNLLSPVSVFYEHAFTRRFALSSSIRGWDFHVNAVKDTRFVHATLEAKFYISKIDRLTSKIHPSGFFLSPYLKGRFVEFYNEVGSSRDEIVAQSLGHGITAGYQWVTRKGLVIEIFHGFGGFPLNHYRHTLRYSSETAPPGDYFKFDLRAGVGIGYAF